MNHTHDSDESRITNHESRLLWYVIQTKPLAEDAVATHLNNAAFQTFLPKIRTMIRGRRTTRVKPLFPAYLFARLDLSDANLYRMIKYTRGVRKILGDGSIPVAIPDEMIELIKGRMDGDGVIEQRLTMQKGDEVRIRTGPFRDLVGILEKPVTSAGRVRVLLQIMKHQIRCDLSAGDVERA
ncbi:MAG: transcription termination/antitermination NusG family protein [bacterium]